MNTARLQDTGKWSPARVGVTWPSAWNNGVRISFATGGKRIDVVQMLGTCGRGERLLGRWSGRLCFLDPSSVSERRRHLKIVERTGATLVVVEHRVDGSPRGSRHRGGRRSRPPTALRRSPRRAGRALRERGIWLPGDDVAAEVGRARSAASSGDTPSPASPT